MAAEVTEACLKRCQNWGGLHSTCPAKLNLLSYVNREKRQVLHVTMLACCPVSAARILQEAKEVSRCRA